MKLHDFKSSGERTYNSDNEYICSDLGRNSDNEYICSDLGSNWCSLGSTHVNTSPSVDPFDAIFDLTGNPVFQNEAWDGWPF